jgi:SAM-dependent methyltransferase
MDHKKILYSHKNQEYFSTIREDIIALVPYGKHKVLEFGCGNGDTLLRLKKLGKAKEIVGVDIYPGSVFLDNFIEGDIETLVLPYPQGYFDIIICADILEHLIDPWESLKNMRNFLNANGTIIISVPNIREIKTMFTIFFRGDFKYQDKGILDKTHLRFFCKKNIIDMVQNTDLKIVKIE